MVRGILGMHGGKPVRETYLPYGQQQIDEYDIQAVVDVLKGDFLTTGPMVQQFEEAIAKYVGAKYAVSFSNGTAALHAACYAAGITEGDEVITTPMTFVASANCILADEPTGNLDKENESNIFNIFKELVNIGKSVVVISHNESVKNYTDTIYELKNGELEEKH
ncbi:UNVERIFIED_CONTAM: aminotransferase class I/II-fold pyridoxal phosphate-dependent enzyme [Bacillus thuringiensis]